MLNFIIQIFKSKKNFLPPKKCKILFIDFIFFKDLKKFFYKINTQFMPLRFKDPSRFQEINFYVIYFTLFKKKEILNTFNYTKNYIYLSNCKVVITGNDNLIWFYKLKNFFSDKKFFVIQNGFRNYLFFNKLKKEKNLEVDYIFTFNKSYSKLYKRSIKSKTFEIGSFRNNLVKKKKFKKEKSILFISSGFIKKKNQIINIFNYKIDEKELYKFDLLLFRYVANFCKKKGFKLIFYPRGWGAMKEKEFNFYRKNLNYKKNIIFFKKRKNLFGISKIYNILYELADKSAITISSSSTFGLENIARKNRTAIFRIRKTNTANIFDIFWNYKLASKGFFWTDKLNNKEFDRVITNLMFKKNDKSYNENLIKKLMLYNYKNKLLIKVVKKTLITNK